MGRIKQTFLKRVAEKAMKEYPGNFSAEFQDNKRKIGAYTDVVSKSCRNKIAGYITKKVKQAAKKKD
jgi:small subunit ribosomal protein S17e